MSDNSLKKCFNYKFEYWNIGVTQSVDMDQQDMTLAKGVELVYECID